MIKVATWYSAIVGAVLVHYRDLRGVTQAELAEAVGVGASTWSRIENGLSALTVQQLALAAKALGTEPHDVLSRADTAARALAKKGVCVHVSPGDTRHPVVEGTMLRKMVASAIKHRFDRLALRPVGVGGVRAPLSLYRPFVRVGARDK